MGGRPRFDTAELEPRSPAEREAAQKLKSVAKTLSNSSAGMPSEELEAACLEAAAILKDAATRAIERPKVEV